MNILLVDGYNMIGAWRELQVLKQDRLLDARDRLIERMAEYKAFTGDRVIIVFDAHLVPGTETKNVQSDVEIIFTKKNETADERIEKLTTELSSRRTKVCVATSDLTEQRVIFGKGALRKSARELELDVSSIQTKISQNVKKIQEEKPKSKLVASEEVMEKLEKFRLGKK